MSDNEEINNNNYKFEKEDSMHNVDKGENILDTQEKTTVKNFVDDILS
jgi:hypothetical protein